MRALILLIVLGALATPASAQSLQVLGYAGVLGEWELTGNVTGKASSHTKEYSGPVTMKHVGVCTQDGPEQKTGEMRIQAVRFIPHEGDADGWRSGVHLQRQAVRQLHRHHELSRPDVGPACHLAEMTPANPSGTH